MKEFFKTMFKVSEKDLSFAENNVIARENHPFYTF